MGLPQLKSISVLEDLEVLRSTGEMDLSTIIQTVLPRVRAPSPKIEKLVVTDHALREFRKKFPRYARPLEEGELLEDLESFVMHACTESVQDGKAALLCHVPIWDKMKVIVDNSRVITVSRAQKESEDTGSRRVFYGILLGIRLLRWSWAQTVQQLCRFHHSNGRGGWGLVLKLRENPEHSLGVFWTIDELLSFWAYRNHHGDVALGQRLAHLARRLDLPAVLEELGTPKMMKQGFEHHGLYVDPPVPHVLRIDVISALIRRS